MTDFQKFGKYTNARYRLETDSGLEPKHEQYSRLRKRIKNRTVPKSGYDIDRNKANSLHRRITKLEKKLRSRTGGGGALGGLPGFERDKFGKKYRRRDFYW